MYAKSETFVKNGSCGEKCCSLEADLQITGSFKGMYMYALCLVYITNARQQVSRDITSSIYMYMYIQLTILYFGNKTGFSHGIARLHRKYHKE